MCEITVRDYELMYILNPEVGEENIPALIEKVNNMITRYGGEITETNHSAPWGKRRLAYPIKKVQDGYYVLAYVRMEPGQVIELERDMRISEDVLRHLLISLDKK